VTNRPELALIGEDGSGYDEYVVPTNPKHRGRAMELFMGLARDLGVTALAKGKKGKAPKRILPAPPKDYRVGDPADLRDDITRLEGIADDKTDPKGKAGPHLTKRALEARRELKEYRPAYRRTKRLADKIDADSERAANAYAALQLADKRGDQKQFDKQLGLYKKFLGSEKTGLESIYGALGKVNKTDTKYGRSVLAKLLDIGGNLQDAGSLALTEAELTPEQQSLLDTGMTLDERARAKAIDAAIALAALTPDLGDDKAAAQQKVDFLGGILAEIQADPGHRGGNDTIASVASDLKNARDNLDSLTNPSGGTTNDNPDLQAQLDQERARRIAAETSSQISEGALKAFGGAGSSGGGPSVVINQTNQMLHPGDPRVLLAVGGAAAAGFDMQGFRRPQSVKVGP
jgi:hypothetical protein